MGAYFAPNLWEVDMNTVEFLRFVLPRKGRFFSATPKSFIGKDGKEVSYYDQVCYDTIGELAEHCVDLSDDGRNAFFACCSHHEPFYYVEYKGEQKKKYRGGENAAYARAQWVDIDCGNEEYPTQKDGLAGLVKFCKETALPRPNVIVNSGNGIHVYWVFDIDVPAAGWQKAAKLFKAILARFNFAQTDTSRTADVASVLRPIGTNNDKTSKGKGIKPVKLVGEPNLEPVSFNWWVKKLVELRDEFGVVVPKGKEPSKNSALSGGIEYAPSDANKVAAKCQQIRIFRDEMGCNQDEPTWRACLGVVGYCEDGEQYATTWSSGHPDYDEDATLDKLDHWMANAGPTTCDHFKGCNPKGCEGCRFAGKITSPIVLGRPDPEHKTEVIEEKTIEVVTQDESTGEQVVETKVEKITHSIPEFPEMVSRNYRWNGEAMVVRRQGENEDEGDNWIPFCSQLPILGDRFFCQDEKCWKWQVKAMVKPGVWNEGDIKASDLAKGGISLLGALGGNLGVVPRGQGADLVAYMRTWAEANTIEQDEVAMHNHFGWHDDRSFLLGTTKYLPDGNTKQVRISSALEVYAKGHVPKGNLPRYVELIDRVYNRPNHQMYQFTWLAGFACPLLRLVHGGPVGIPLTSWSKESGFGKTTAALAAVSIWGNPYAPNQVASANKVTEYALYVMAGAKRDLPVVLDEVTMWEPKRTAKFCYDYSDGRPRIQGQASGGLRDNSNLEWASFMMTTTNRSVVQDMVSTIPDCAPQVARVIEYRYDALHHETLSRADGVALFDELWKHSGVAGDAFLRYVVPKQDQVRERCVKARDALALEAGVEKDGRYWLLGAAVIWVAYEIAKELGMCNFDPEPLRAWIIDQLRDMKGSAGEANRDVLEMFGDMMSDMQRGMLVTDSEGDRRNGKPASFLPGFGVPNGTITGRAIQDKKLVYLSQTAMREWCTKRGISAKEMENQLAAKGWLKTVSRFALGKGLVLSISQVKCLVLDWAAFESHLLAVPQPQTESVNAA